jgi:hypothetical protein
MERPIFLLGSHKSGTSLLRSLLDGVSGLFVVPLETHFFQFGGYWVDYALRRARPVRMTFNELVARLVHHVRLSNERVSATGDSVLVGRWNVDHFADYLRATGAKYFDQGDVRGLFDSYIGALHVSLYDTPLADGSFLEKSVENAEYAVLLSRLYPNARFLHVLRNPYATLVSLRRHIGRRHYPFLGNLLASLNNSYYYLYKNPLLIPGLKIVRYEDLVANPEHTMADVAEFLNIAFCETLLTPTVMSLPWAGNSTSGELLEGISTRPLTAWHDSIQPLEAKFVSTLFDHVLRDHGYARREEEGSIYRPAPAEGWRTYLANRYLWQVVAQTQGLPT